MARSIDRDLVSSLLHRRAARSKASVKEFWEEIVPLLESPLRAVRLYETTRAPFPLPPLRPHDVAYPHALPFDRRRSERFEHMVADVTTPDATVAARRKVMRHLPAVLAEEPLASAGSEASLVNGVVDIKALIHHFYETKRDWLQRDARHEAIRSLISCLRTLPRDPRALDPENPRALLHLLILSCLGSLMPPDFSEDVGRAMLREGLLEAITPYVGGFASWMEQVLAIRAMSAVSHTSFGMVAPLVGSAAMDSCEYFILRHPEIAAARGATNPFTAPAYNGLLTPNEIDMESPELTRALQGWPALRERRRQVSQITSEVIFSTTTICEQQPGLSRTILTPLRLAVARSLTDSVSEESCASVRILHACAAPTTPISRARLAFTSGTLEHVATSTLYNLPAGAIAATCALLQRLHAAGMLSSDEREAVLTGSVAGLLLGTVLGPHRELCRLAVETVFEVASGLNSGSEAGSGPDMGALLSLLQPTGGSAGAEREDQYAAACAAIDAQPRCLRLLLSLSARMIDVCGLRSEALAKAGRGETFLPAMSTLGENLQDSVTTFVKECTGTLRLSPHRFVSKVPTEQERSVLPASTPGSWAAADAAPSADDQPHPGYMLSASGLERCRPLPSDAMVLASASAAFLQDKQYEEAIGSAAAALWMCDWNDASGQLTGTRALVTLSEALAASGNTEMAMGPAIALLMAFDPPGSGDPQSWELDTGISTGDASDDDDGTNERKRSPFPRRNEAKCALGTAARVLTQLVMTKGWPGSVIVGRLALASATDSVEPLRVPDGIDPSAWYMGTPPRLESRPERLPASISVGGLLVGCIDQQVRRALTSEMNPTSGVAIAGGERQGLVQRITSAEYGRTLVYAVLREAGRGSGGGKPLAAMATGKATAAWVRKLIKWLPDYRLYNAWFKARRTMKTYTMENMTSEPEAAQAAAMIRREVESQMNGEARRVFAEPYRPANNVWWRTMGWMEGTEALMRRERAIVDVVYSEMMQRFGGGFVPDEPFPREAAKAGQAEAGDEQ